MSTKFVKPGKLPDGTPLLVRLEDCTRHVFEAGEHLPNTSYLRRRLRDGDLVEAKPPPAPKPAKPAKES